MFNKKLYINKHTPFIDRIIYLNRIKIVKIIHNYLKDEKLNSILDVGTTNDKNKSSNILIKKLKFFNEYK